jgi:hypothetical protein
LSIAQTTVRPPIQQAHSGSVSSAGSAGASRGGAVRALRHRVCVQGLKELVEAVSAEDGYAAVEMAERITNLIRDQAWAPSLATAAGR